MGGPGRRGGTETAQAGKFPTRDGFAARLDSRCSFFSCNGVFLFRSGGMKREGGRNTGTTDGKPEPSLYTPHICSSGEHRVLPEPEGLVTERRTRTSSGNIEGMGAVPHHHHIRSRKTFLSALQAAAILESLAPTYASRSVVRQPILARGKRAKQHARSGRLRRTSQESSLPWP